MKRKYLILYLFLSLFIVLKSERLDSLYKSWLDRSKPDSLRVVTLYYLSFDYLQINLDSAEKLAKTGAELSFKLNKPSLHANFLLTIGGANFYRGNYSKALDCFYAAEKIFTDLNRPEGLSGAMTNIANVFYANKDYKKAIEYYLKSLSILDKKKNANKVAAIYLNLGASYSDNGEQKEALNYFTLAIEQRKLMNDSLGMANTQTQLITFYLNQNNTAAAEPLLNSTYAILNRYNDAYGLMFFYLYKASYFLKISEPKEAVVNYRKSLAYAEQLNFAEPKKDAYLGLYEAYHNLKMPDSALVNHIRYTKWKDSLQNQNTSNEITRQQLNFEYEKQKAIDEKESENKLALAKEKEQKQKVITSFTVAGLVLLLFVILFIINRLRITNKQKLIIQEQKHLVDEKQKEIFDSLQYAKQIQKTLLANHKLVNETLPDSFVVFKPKDIVSGDFYWATKKEDRFYIAVCDSTGHGVPGAFMSLLNINFLNEAINEKNIQKPNEIFDHVRKRLIDNISQEGRQDGMDGILICIEKGKLTYAAANNAPVIVQNNTLKVLDTDKMPVGKGERPDPFKLHTIEIKKGDLVFLYTDGYADQFGGPKGKKLKYKPLNDILIKNHNLPVLQQEEILYKEFETWKGTLDQVDDVCIIGFRY